MRTDLITPILTHLHRYATLPKLTQVAKKSILMSREEYKKLPGEKEDIVSFFKRSPLKGIDIKLKRDSSKAHNIDL